MTIEEILALLQSVLDNPNATPEEITAVLGQVQEALMAMAQPVEAASDDANPDTSSAPTPVSADQLAKAAQAVVTLKKRADAALKARKEIADALAHVKAATTPTNGLPFGTKSMPKIEVKSRFKSRTFKSNEDAYKSGMWLLAVNGDRRAEKWCNDHGIELKTITEGNTASAGLLVPEEWEDAIWNLKEPRGVIRQIARTVNMSSPVHKRIKSNGGTTAYFVGEGSAPSESSISYTYNTLSAKKLAVLVKATYEINDDAIVNIVDEITQEMSYKFTDKEDACGFIGDGTSTYGGITGLRYKYQSILELGGGTWATDADKAKLGSAKVATGSTWSSITRADITGLRAKVRGGGQGGNNAYYCSSVFYYEVLLPLIHAAGGLSGTESANGVTGERFDGFPVRFVEVMPTATAVSDIPLYFGDASQAIDFGDLKQTTIETFKNIQTQVWDIVGTERFDINAHDLGNYNATAGSRTRGSLAALITKNS